MSNKPSELTEEQAAALIARRRGGASVAELARQYAMVPSTLRDFFTTRSVTVQVVRVVKPKPEAGPEEITQQVRHDREVAQLKAEARQYRKLYTRAVEASASQENLMSALKDTVTALPVLSPQPVSVPSNKAKGQHTALAHLSDLHNGEVVSSAAMGGLSEFDMEIFRQRVGLWVEKLLHLVDLRRGRLEIPRLTIFEDGDLVSGIIHDELVRTNQVHIVDQVSVTALLMATAIAQVSQYFEEVEVSCTPGNHGRTQQKTEFKEPHVNWDYVCYQLQALYLKDYPNIKFDIPQSLWQITRVENVDWLHFHGHGIRGWNGIPYYGISRAVKAIREALAVGHRSFDAVAMAHFHVPMIYQMPTGPLVINGCWKGGDEFALSGLHTITRPVQLLTIVHDKYGALGTEPIFLDHNRPEHADKLPARMEDVWADEKI